MASTFWKRPGDKLMAQGRVILYFLQNGWVGWAVHANMYVAKTVRIPITTADVNNFKTIFSDYIRKECWKAMPEDKHKLLKDTHEAMMDEVEGKVIWTYPNKGLKLNTDGAGTIGIGGLFRDCNGRLILAFCQRVLPGYCSATVESMALRLGLKLYSQVLQTHPKYRNLPLVVETDSLDLSRHLTEVWRGHKPSKKAEQTFELKSYEEFMTRHPGKVVAFNHVRRQGNGCADVLAYFGALQKGYEMIVYTGDECEEGACDGKLKCKLERDRKHKIPDTYEGGDEENDW